MARGRSPGVPFRGLVSWRISFDRATCFVSGDKAEARRRIAACGDASPMWVERRRAWATSASVGNAVASQLEARRIPVVVENADQGALDLTETVPANLPPAQGGLF